MLITVIGVILGLTFSNFFWQVLTGKKEWFTAFSFSLFQAVAIIALLVALYFNHYQIIKVEFIPVVLPK